MSDEDFGDYGDFDENSNENDDNQESYEDFEDNGNDEACRIRDEEDRQREKGKQASPLGALLGLWFLGFFDKPK